MGNRRFALSFAGLALLVGLVGGGVALPGLSSPAQAQYATPSEYGVTIRRIEFKTSAGVWVPYFEGSQLIDIAAVDAGAQAGMIGGGGKLPSGSYTAIRITISQTFVLKAILGLGPDCTSSGNNGTNTAGNCASPGDETSQQVPIPAAAVFPLFGWEEGAGETMYKEFPVSFSVPANGAFVPDFSISFSVQGATGFNVAGGCGAAGVCPADPQINVE